VKFVDQPLF